MNYYLPMHSSPPVNWSREMGEYYNREAARVMGYRFERPSSKVLVIRRPTPAEREAHDTTIDALREERGGVDRIAAAQAHSAACFAAARVNAVAALARAAARKKGSGGTPKVTLRVEREARNEGSGKVGRRRRLRRRRSYRRTSD